MGALLVLYIYIYIYISEYSCLENPVDRGAWQATVHGVARVRHDLVTKPLPYVTKSFCCTAEIKHNM